MRDPARIDRILAKLAKYWHHYPDLRFTQLLIGLDIIAKDRDDFYTEDTKIESQLDTPPFPMHPLQPEEDRRS